MREQMGSAVSTLAALAVALTALVGCESGLSGGRSRDELPMNDGGPAERRTDATLPAPPSPADAGGAPAPDASVEPVDPPIEPVDPPVEPPPEPPIEPPAEPPADPPADTPPADEPPASPPPADACLASTPLPPADGCPFPLEVVMWTTQAWNIVGDAFAANTSPCGHYWLSVSPVTSDKTTLRAGEAARMHARGPRLHALAEFHWQTWAAHRRATGTTWREIGREFRRRMEGAGYCVESGDGWMVNEMPTTVRTDAAVRAGFMELVAGLREGAAGMSESRGAVLVWNMGHATTNFAVYEPSWRSFLADAAFWERMNAAVRWWGQEAYVDPRFTCVPGSTLAARTDHMAEFAMHPARLAAAAPDSAGANAAQSYFSRAYFPLMNGVWHSAPTNGYGDTRVPMSEMTDLLSEQVFAARAYADTHAYPDGRIGFAFASYHTPSEWTALATQTARALRNAYGRGNTADSACYEDGVRTRCSCNVSGAAFNPGWSTFATW